MSVSGHYVYAEGTRLGDNQWTVNMTRGCFGPKLEEFTNPVVEFNISTTQSSEKTADSRTTWEKTADFASRTLSGAASAAVPFAACQALRGTVPTLASACDVALFTTGLGLLAASTTDTAEAACHRGLQIGSVAQAATLMGGVGEGTLWNKAVDVKNWGGTQLSAVGTGIAKCWTNMTASISKNAYQPICDWSNKGESTHYVAWLFRCAN